MVQTGQRKGKSKVKTLNRVVLPWILIILILGMNQLSLSNAVESNILSSITNILPYEDFNYSFDEVGQYSDRYGAPIDIVLQGELAFLASEWGGLLIFNISNPTQPILISTYTDNCMITDSNACMDEATMGVEIINDLVLFAFAKKGLLLINVSKPTEPYLQGKYSRYLYDVKVQGNYAYLLCPGNRSINYGDVIQIVDISDATHPIFIGELDYSLIGGFMWDICVIDNYIYSVSAGELVIIDATNLSHPEEITRLNIGGADILTAYNDYIFAGNSTTVKIVDVQNPLAPILIKELPLAMGDITSISTNNNTVYLVDFSKPEIIALNVTDIEHPAQIGKIQDYSTIGNCWKALALSTTKYGNELLFCSDYRLGLFCFDVTNKSQINLLGFFDTNCKATSLTVEEDYAYICSRREYPYYPSRLEIISIANYSQPLLMGKYDFQGDTLRDVIVNNGFAYLSLAAGGLVIMDVNDPTQPKPIGSYNHNATVGYFENLWYDETSQLVYLTHPYYDLLIINCSDPTTPTLVSTFEIGEPFYMSNIFIENNIAYLTSSSSEGSIAIVDVNNPKEPALLYWTSVGDAIIDIHVNENRAYLVMQYNYLEIMDVGDPTSPSQIGTLKNWWFQTQAIYVSNSVAFIAQYAAGLRAVDISDPKNPVEIAAIRDHYRGVCYDVFVQGDYILIADGWDGLEILELVPPKISYRNYLLMTILPPIGGVCLVIVIVIIQYSKNKKTAN